MCFVASVIYFIFLLNRAITIKLVIPSGSHFAFLHLFVQGPVLPQNPSLPAAPNQPSSVTDAQMRRAYESLGLKPQPVNAPMIPPGPAPGEYLEIGGVKEPEVRGSEYGL